MINQEVIIIAVDPASREGDYSAEAEIKIHPDGRLEVIAVWTWKHELDLTPS
ncbi:hypothetical protein V1279_003090 [Bradyrhizobium sp. AZCC 1610]|uniref:hypothetical protein n=1 Tax=Bradyrhizobium sp. AZCC 1610 TaxID=3117020 RepID=UPI002FF04A86